MFRVLTQDPLYVYLLSIYVICNSYDSIGCAIAIDIDGISGVTGRFRLGVGVVKYYFSRRDRVLIHMFSPEEGVTKFATLPKALKEVSACYLMRRCGRGIVVCLEKPEKLVSQRKMTCTGP